MANGEQTLDDIQDLVGRELDGRYVLEKYLDRGGYGAVYVGTDKKFNQPVAVKVGLSSREFMKEARLAAEVKHNHIVQVTDYGSDKGLAYLVMEYLQGEDLEKLFKRQGCQLKPDQLRKLVNEVGDALAYAHADHLIHRDLKPRNIILKEHFSKSGTTSGNTKFVLLDFGIAAKLDSEGTQRNRTQDGAGTVEYMAPELLSRDPRATPQSDIYAFGVILYQMMVGRVPFQQSDTSHMALAECLNAISNSPPPRFREISLDRVYPAALEELVIQCLDKDPSRRPQTMSEIRHRFIEIVDHSAKAARSTKKNPLGLTGTIQPEELVDSDEDDDDDSTPQKSASSVPARSSMHWLWIIMSFMVVLAGSMISGLMFLAPVPFDTLADEHGNPIDPTSPLVLTAGKSLSLTFAINELSKDAEVKFDYESAVTPQIVEIKLANGPIPGTSKTFVLSVPDLNYKSTDSPSIKLRATNPRTSKTFERTIPLTIVRPEPWLPAEIADIGFHEAPDSRRCFVGEQVFATLLERRVHGKSVRFRLVPMTKIGDRTVNTFYIMEQLVTNGLFNEFSQQQPGFEIETRKQQPPRWESPDVAESPVTDVYALEAQKFARWLAGSRRGTLPSTTEWELAAGYWDFVRVLEGKFGSGREIPSDGLRDLRPMQVSIPYTGAEVWIGLGPSLGQFQEPNGELLKGRSPYGCEYPRLPNNARPTELTSSLMDFSSGLADLRTLCQNGVPGVDDPNLKKEYNAALRGSGPEGEEISWIKGQETRSLKSVKDLTDEAGEFTLTPGEFGKSDYAGFRVVLLTAVDQ